MKKFSQFKIEVTSKCFVGDKIKMAKILNREIIVHDFKLGDSKIFLDRGTGKCLQLQISVNEEKHILFTSSIGLIEAIQQVPADDFPFTATIIEENDRFKFT
jgi:hypothetical protein